MWKDTSLVICAGILALLGASFIIGLWMLRSKKPKPLPAHIAPLRLQENKGPSHLPKILFIDQLLMALYAWIETAPPLLCPVCKTVSLIEVLGLRHLRLSSTIRVCRACLACKTYHRTGLWELATVPYPIVLQQAIDQTRAGCERYLVQEQLRHARALNALQESPAQRLFPNHQERLEWNLGAIEASIRRIQDEIDKLPPDIVEKTIAHIAAKSCA